MFTFRLLAIGSKLINSRTFRGIEIGQLFGAPLPGSKRSAPEIEDPQTGRMRPPEMPKGFRLPQGGPLHRTIRSDAGRPSSQRRRHHIGADARTISRCPGRPAAPCLRRCAAATSTSTSTATVRRRRRPRRRRPQSGRRPSQWKAVAAAAAAPAVASRWWPRCAATRLLWSALPPPAGNLAGPQAIETSGAYAHFAEFGVSTQANAYCRGVKTSPGGSPHIFRPGILDRADCANWWRTPRDRGLEE